MSTTNRSLMELMVTMARVTRAYRIMCDRLASRYGLTQAIAWPILSINRLGDGVRPSVVAESVGLEPSSIVRLIDKLVASGFIERRPDHADKRAKLLYLTDFGKQNVAALEKELDALRKDLLEDLTNEQFDTCMQFFTKLGYSIKKYKGLVGNV